MIKADINKVKNLFKQLIEEVAVELLQEYKTFATYIGLERIIRNTINDEVVEKEALKMNKEELKREHTERFIDMTHSKLKQAVFEIKLMMKTGVKRFNNSLSDKFLDMINDNFKKKLLKANLMRRKKRQ